MTPPVIPIVPNQEISTPPANPDTTNNTPTDDLNNNVPDAAANVDQIRQVYDGVLRETNERARRAEQELEQLRAQRNAPPAATPEQDVETLTTNPRQLIREEIQAALAPIQAQSNQFAKQNMMITYREQMRNDTRFQLVNHDSIWNSILGLLQQNPNPDANAMMAAYYAAVGMAQSNGTLPTNNPAPSNPPAPTPVPNSHNNSVPNPPNPRPAPPNPPRNPNTPVRRALSENEEYLRKNIYKMTVDEYLDFIDVPASDVANSKIGLPAPAVK